MILDAAEVLIFKHGIDRVYISDIAGAAGYTRRSIYLYFKDRDDIFYCIVYRGQKLFLKYLDRAADMHSKGEDAVGVFCDAVFDFASENQEYFDLLLQYELRQHDYGKGPEEEDSPKSDCHNISIDYGKIVMKAIEKDLREGRISSGLTARQLMMMFWGQVFGLMQIILKRRKDFSSVYEIEQHDFLEEFKQILRKTYYS